MNIDTTAVSTSLLDYYGAPNAPAEPVINRATRRHEKALLRRAEKKRRG